MTDIITAAPLTLDQLKTSITDKTISYIFNHNTSRLKGKSLVNYMCNLEVNVDVDVIGLDFQTKQDMIVTWMTTKQIKYINSFALEVYELCYMDILGTYIPLTDKQFFNVDEKKTFLQNHKTLVEEWCCFFRSIPYFLSFSLLDEHIIKLAETENIIVDDINAVGNNVISMLKFPDFTTNIIAIDKRENKFYMQQYTNPVFRGRHLIEWLKTTNNPLYILVMMLGMEKLPFDKFASMATINMDFQS
jgi:hypothetical protein